MALSLRWNEENTPEELHGLLSALGEEYPIHAGEGGDVTVSFEESSSKDRLTVSREGEEAVVSYGRINQAARGVGALLAGLPPREQTLTETTPFTTFGIMLDCSRNAVMKVDHFKKWLRRLALFGYNMAMLYTEDTYELPGEEYFGYLRGRYTAEELKEIDRYAAGLGIEMIGCIQTLGHLGQVLKWPAYRRIKDTGSVLLTSEEGSYRLIDEMLDLFGECFTSRRIHLGMDEAHDLGRGRYLDLNGYRRGFDIFNEHLERVVERCEERGIKPMIWSDMYFRMGSKSGGYYDPECIIPQDVAAEIPEGAQLVYWDYYHKDENFYRDWIQRHRELGSEPAMASGVWTWKKLWYHHGQTRQTVTPCLKACRAENVKEVFFTLWGDDGAYCEFDSCLAGLCYAAQRGFNDGEPDTEVLEKRFQAACGADYGTTIMPDEAFNGGLPTASLLWDDPLQGIFYNEIAGKENDTSGLEDTVDKLAELAGKAKPDGCEGGEPDMGHVRNLAIALREKISLRLKLVDAYSGRDEERLREVSRESENVIARIDQLGESFRRQWYRRNKPQGFEAIQIRLAGQKARHRELQRRIDELLAGETDVIPELEERPVPKGAPSSYRGLATASSIL